MEDKKDKVSFKEIHDNMIRSFDQFIFLIFISNPQTRFVKIYIDGKISYSINMSELEKILRNTCPYKDVNVIMMKCSEYGVPYIYDRNNHTIKQLSGNIFEKRMDYMKEQIKNGHTVEEKQKDIIDLFSELSSTYDKAIELDTSK